MLVNDDVLGGYILFNVGVGMIFVFIIWLKKLMVCLNVYNLFDKQYFNFNGGSGSQFIINVVVVNGIFGIDFLFYIGVLCIFIVILIVDF